MAVLFVTHDRYFDHDTGRGHPERSERLEAVLSGAQRAGLAEALVPLAPREAQRAELERVHPTRLLNALQDLCANGGGHVDGDTIVSSESWDAAVLAAGAGLAAIEALDRGEGEAAFCAVRPPGHHATPTRAMGFCLVNNVAVAASALAARGERVVIVDYDAHHGNGTQDAFYTDDRVLYVSFHQWPLYPGSGALHETGSGAGEGTTMNFPFPPGTTGDAYLAAVDELVAPTVERFAPTWLLISAGFDAHRRDPIAGLGLTSGDYSLLTRRLLEFAPAGKRLVLLEGGYDLQALADSTAAALGALLGVACEPETPTSGGPGKALVEAAKRQWAMLRGE